MEFQRLTIGDLGEVTRELIKFSGEWYDFGKELGIREKTLNSISRNFHYAKDKLEALIEAWLKAGAYEPRWSSLVDALNRIGESTLASNIEKKLYGGNYLAEDSEAEMEWQALHIGHINEVIAAIKTISEKWKQLGAQLGVDLSALELIGTQHQRDQDRLRSVLEKWLKGGLGSSNVPTWKSLVAALKGIYEEDLAGKLERKHCFVAEDSVVEDSAAKPDTRPTLSELFPIPISNSQWFTLGDSLGLSEGDLNAIQENQKTDHKRKRAMFKRWLEVDSGASWKKLIEALDKLGEKEVVEKVRMEYGISADSHSLTLPPTSPTAGGNHGNHSSTRGGSDEPDGVEDSSTMKSTSKPLMTKLPQLELTTHQSAASNSAEYLAVVSCRSILVTGMTTVSADLIASKLFQKALLTKEEKEYTTHPEAASSEKAEHLAAAIEDKIRENPKALPVFVEVLKQTPEHVQIASLLEDTARLYQIFLELQRLPPHASKLDVSTLARRLLDSKLVASGAYQELTLHQTDSAKVHLLHNHLSRRGLSRPFLQMLDLFPAFASLADELRKTVNESQVSPAFPSTKSQSTDSRTSRELLKGTAAQEGERFTTGIGKHGIVFSDSPERRLSAPIEEHPVRHKSGSERQSNIERRRPATEIQKPPAQSPPLTSTPLSVHQQAPPEREWETPTEVSTAHKRRAATEQHKVRGKPKKKKERKNAQDSSLKKTSEKEKPVTEILSHKGRMVAMASTDSHGEPVPGSQSISQGAAYSPREGSQVLPSAVTSSETTGHGLASATPELQLESLSLGMSNSQERTSDTVPEHRRPDMDQGIPRTQKVMPDDGGPSSSESYHSTTDMIYDASSPSSAQPRPLKRPLSITSETEPHGILSLGGPFPAGRTSVASTPYSPSLPGLNTTSTSLSSTMSTDFYITQYRDAVLKGDTENVELLLQKGIDVDIPLKDGSTALMLASADGHAGVIKELLKHKASVKLTDKTGATALHLAASHGNYEAVKLLVEAFADVNSVTRDHTSLLLPPASKGFSIIVEYLLQNGANPNMADKGGNTPLIAATSRGQKDVVKVLLERGADVNAVSKETSRTALQEAVKGDFTDIIVLLAKATSEVSEKSRRLFTCKTAEIVRRLIGQGAKVGERRGDDATPLMIQVERGNREVVEELIRAGASVDCQDEDGLTALMRAAKTGNVEMVQTILAAGAITDLRDKRGQSALLLAVQSGHTRVARELTMAGADPNLRDKNGRSPAMVARAEGGKEMAEVFERQTVVTDSKDPFLNLLSDYLGKMSEEQSEERTKKEKAVQKLQKKTTGGAKKMGGASSRDSTPKESEETSTLRDQLNKAWRRIADLETRIHDLTLQSTVEITDTTDLTYLDRGRMETEFRKLRELKRKSEQYAIEAKQTAQRLSAENFKLKEDLSRERHHNELTRKNMLREMEQQLDKQATGKDRADAKMEVFEEEVTERARQMAMRMVPAQASHLPRVEFKPSQVRDLLFRHSVRASVVQVGVAGMPYSGKSTLVCNMLEFGATSVQAQREHARVSLEAENSLSVYEAVVMKDMVNNECLWLHSVKEDAEVLVVATALAQVCAKSHQFPTFSGSKDKKAHETGSLFGDHDIEEGFSRAFESLRKLMVRFEQKGQINHLTTTSLSFMSVVDVGVNKAVYEIMSILAARCKNFVLLSFLSLETDVERLYQTPNLEDRTVYHGRYSARNDDKMLMKLQTTLHYYTRVLLANSGHDCIDNTALLIGSHADKLSKSQVTEAKRKVLQSVNGKAEELGIGDAVRHGIITVDAREKDDAMKVRAALEDLIEQGNRYERDIPLTWLFFRYILFLKKKLFVTRAELFSVGKKCGIQSDDELEEWLGMFQSFGSIIYSPSGEFPMLHDNIVLEPVKFIQDLDRLYYVREQQDDVMGDMEDHVGRTESGFLSFELAEHLWADHCGFYLRVLQNLGIIVQVDEILDEACADTSKCFFMPSLRPYHSKEFPTADSTSLIVIFNTEMPYHKQSDLVVYLKQHHNRHIRLVPENFYNVLHFKWFISDSVKIADIYVRFLGELVEISIVMAPEGHQGGLEGTHSEICSVLKTACVEVFHKSTQELLGLQFNLAIMCPSCADPKNSSDRKLHYLKFHPLQHSLEELFCDQCQRKVVPSGERALWVLAAYQGPVSLAMDPEDSVTVTEVAELAQALTHLSLQDMANLALNLGFSMTEVEARRQEIPAEDVLFVLLVEWVSRRRPLRAKQVLAHALAECGQYALAVKLDPSRL